MNVEIQHGTPILPELERIGVEADQRLRLAIERLPPVYMVGDQYLFLELIRLNTAATRLLDLGTFDPTTRWQGEGPAVVATPTTSFRQILNDALKNRRDRTSLGTIDVLYSWIRRLQNKQTSWAAGVIEDNLLGRHSGQQTWESPRALELFRTLAALDSNAEDFQFVLALEADTIRFRVTSVLGDFVQAEGGLLVPRRAILTHFKDRFGGFTQDEIGELEELMNDPRATESDVQRFFEAHSHFFRKWDYREVYPHVVLRHPQGELIPDFILVDRDLQKAAILELKLPSPMLIRRQKNRERFASAIAEARAQLLTYRDWFREPRNRKTLKERVGIEVYEPHLAVIIGRASEFVDSYDRQRLASSASDVEVVTYDDMLTYARRRRLIIESSLI